MRQIVIFLTTLAFLVLFSSPAFAALFINEFSSDTAGTIADPDWVEIYNSDSFSVDLSQYRLEDLNATNKKTLTGTIDSSGFITIDWSNKLNKAGDIISLIKISDSQVIDRVAYGDQGSDVVAPTAGQSAGRNSDGSGSWVIFTSPTKNSTNNTSIPASPTPTPTPTPSPTPTSTTSQSSSSTKSPSPTPKASPTQTALTPSPTAKKSPQVLSAESTGQATPQSAVTKTPSPTPTPAPKAAFSKTKIAAMLTGSGALLIGLSFGFYLWYKRALTPPKDQEKDQDQ